jgi:hypothetical protein
MYATMQINATKAKMRPITIFSVSVTAIALTIRLVPKQLSFRHSQSLAKVREVFIIVVPDFLICTLESSLATIAGVCLIDKIQFTEHVAVFSC